MAASSIGAPSRWRQAQESQQQERAASERLRGQLHGIQLEAVRLGELIQRVKHRAGQIDDELEEITAQEEELRGQRGEADSRFEQLDQELATRQEAVETARVAYEDADARLREARDQRQRLQADAVASSSSSARHVIAPLI